MKKRLVRLLAWAVTAGILFLLFRKIPFHDVVAAARGAAGWTVPAAFFFGFVIYLADSFAIWKTFGWFLLPREPSEGSRTLPRRTTPGGAELRPRDPLPLKDILLVRGATYLLAAINYNVGQGAIVYFVHRVARVPVMRGVATVLLIMGINVLALLFLATFGLGAAPDVPHAVKVIVAVAYAGLAVYVAAVIAKPRWLATRPALRRSAGRGPRRVTRKRCWSACRTSPSCSSSRSSCCAPSASPCRSCRPSSRCPSSTSSPCCRSPCRGSARRRRR